MHKVEFAQVYTAGTGKNGGGGFYTLYSGNRNSVQVPVANNSFLINHTHPGGTPFPSPWDIGYLIKSQAVGSPQKSSVIIPLEVIQSSLIKTHQPMETNDSIENFDPSDKEYWEQAHRFALVKENHDGINFYSIFAVDGPALMMTLIDNFEYGMKLTNKMIENGVRVFEDFGSLVKWHEQKKSHEDGNAPH